MSTPRFALIGTMPSRALALLLSGHAITHKDFWRHAGTYRLSAPIYTLRASGWPILDQFETVPTSDPTKRQAYIKRYYLPHAFINEMGEAGQDYARKVREWESRAAGTVAPAPMAKNAGTFQEADKGNCTARSSL